LLVLSAAYTEEKITKDDGSVDERIVLRIPPALAPVKLAVFPLVKKDGLPDKARQIMEDLKVDFKCQYEEKDSIGKRYRRHDAIGTPFCITVDHQSLEDNTVTIRHRDTMEQERVDASRLREIMEQKVSMKTLLKSI
jgi:glycyl-tRNA synthetase